MASKGFSFRGIIALCGGMALFLWGLSVCLGVGVGYDRPIESLNLFASGVLWQLFKGACLITMAVAVVKEEIDAVESRAQAAFLQATLMECEKRHMSNRSE